MIPRVILVMHVRVCTITCPYVRVCKLSCWHRNYILLGLMLVIL